MLMSVTRNLLVLGLIAACSPAPERFVTSGSADGKKKEQGAIGSKGSDLESNGNNTPEDDDNDNVDPTIEPDVPKIDPVETKDPIKVPEPAPNPIPTPEPEPQPQPKPEPVVPSAVPKNCQGDSTVDAKDLVIFDGKAVSITDNKVPLSADWIINDSWGNAKLGSETKNDQTVITFTGETIYHGFKITPISPAGQQKKFVATGVDLYVSASKEASAFGLRIIKPGEFEGDGGAQTTSWFKSNAQSNEPDNKPGTPSLSTNCKLIRFYITPSFVQNNKVSTRFIWEMMTNWNPGDKLYLHKIVMKDFSWK